jgi:hypothetical protein
VPPYHSASRGGISHVTLRHVKRDPTSVLSFATTDRIAAVMSFSQKVNPNGETDMIRVTEELIDLVASLGGQLLSALRLMRDRIRSRRSTGGTTLRRAQRHYDPGLLFQNTMWNTYFSREGSLSFLRQGAAGPGVLTCSARRFGRLNEQDVPRRRAIRRGEIQDDHLVGERPQSSRWYSRRSAG